jgi:glycosyltransferase involved in cell wall biosynthesis
MTTSLPLVSIVIPAYNAERFLAEALASVRGQSYNAIEVIVCDDASTDATPAIAQGTGDPRVRYLRNEQTLGGYGAMNRGVRDSRGDYVAIYHADDVYDPRIVERELAFLLAHDEVGAVFCLDRFIDELGHEYGRLQLPPALRTTQIFDAALLAESLLRYKNTFLRTPSVMFRRASFDAVAGDSGANGGFDQSRFGIAADLDMWTRLSIEWRIGLVHEYLLGYRHYTAQWSRQYERMRTEPEIFFAAMDRHLSRPGIRAQVSAEALTCYRVWQVRDEAERAANAYVLGDRHKAVALLNSSLVRPLLRSSRRAQVARVLALRTLVRAAAATGTSKHARSLIHFARFRRFPPGDLAPPSARAAHSLANRNAGAASNEIALTSTAAASPAGPPPRSRIPDPRSPLRVFLDPFTRHFHGNQLFDPQCRFNRDGALLPWVRLRERLAARGVPIDTADYLAELGKPAANRDAANVYVSFGLHDAYQPLVKRDDVLLNAFYLFEAIIVDPAMYHATPELARHFRTIYGWTSAEQLRPFVPDVPVLQPFRIPMPFGNAIEPHWSRRDRHGIVLVNSNKRAVLPSGELYTERLRVLKHFAANGGVDLWGRLWEHGLGELEAEFGDAVRQTWRGPVDDKHEAMSRYRFAICYENMILDGWITEKLFDCLYAGAVPVYLGAPDIGDAVDPNCYIDARRFANYGEMQRYLDEMTDVEYEAMRVAGRDYLSSAQFRQFSPDGFADRFIRDIEAHVQERGLAHLWG